MESPSRVEPQLARLSVSSLTTRGISLRRADRRRLVTEVTDGGELVADAAGWHAPAIARDPQSIGAPRLERRCAAAPEWAGKCQWPHWAANQCVSALSQPHASRCLASTMVLRSKRRTDRRWPHVPSRRLSNGNRAYRFGINALGANAPGRRETRSRRPNGRRMARRIRDASVHPFKNGGMTALGNTFPSSLV
jgi:hypothetical protein